MSPTDLGRLAELGWKPSYLQDVTLEELDDCTIGRVTSVERDRFGIATDGASSVAVLPGRLRHDDTAPLPTVGDWVLLDEHADHTMIRRVLARTSLLERTAPGQEERTSAERQLLCANVDTVLVVASLDGDGSANLRRIERYLALVRGSGVQAVVVLTKADLSGAPESELEGHMARLAPTHVVALDARDSGTRERLAPWLLPTDTLALLGPSGVGKSTLANTLAGEVLQRTGAVREGDAKGRHTTTRRSLFRLPGGVCLIDTPGMRELALSVDETSLGESFDDIAALARACRFVDCDHDGEPDCAVSAALENGTLAVDRWEGYRRLIAESRTRKRLAESVKARRVREKAFGKAVRNAMQNKSRRRRGD